MANNSNSQQMAFNAGETKGQTQEKANTMMDKASNAANSVKETVQEAGQQVKAAAEGTVDAVKNATGTNK